MDREGVKEGGRQMERVRETEGVRERFNTFFIKPVAHTFHINTPLKHTEAEHTIRGCASSSVESNDKLPAH